MSSGLSKLVVFGLLKVVRAALARSPTPEMMRTEMRRAGKLVALQEPLLKSAPFALGGGSAHWIDSPGIKPSRVILYLHGGAFIAESPAIHDPLLAAICRASNARGLMVNYRLAPENPFPAGSDDCLAAYKYLLAQGMAPENIVIAGDSAGGNLAVVTAIRARNEGLAPAAGMVLLSPVLDASFSGDSIRRNEGIDPMFRASIIEGFAPYYGAGIDRRHPWLSPLWTDLSSLPPALLMAGSSEILLDDSVRYASRAANSTLVIWHDMPHVFPALRGLPEGPQAIQQIGAWIQQKAVPVILKDH